MISNGETFRLIAGDERHHQNHRNYSWGNVLPAHSPEEAGFHAEHKLDVMTDALHPVDPAETDQLSHSQCQRDEGHPVKVDVVDQAGSGLE